MHSPLWHRRAWPFCSSIQGPPGPAPHRYIIICWIEYAKRLLAETDVPRIDIGLQVGCADQSHFTALFRMHDSLTPKAYRDNTKS